MSKPKYVDAAKAANEPEYLSSKSFFTARVQGGWVWGWYLIVNGYIKDSFISEPDILKVASDRMKIEYQKHQNETAATGWSQK